MLLRAWNLGWIVDGSRYGWADLALCADGRTSGERRNRFPVTSGDMSKGSIMAFRVVADARTQNPKLEPAWIRAASRHLNRLVIAGDVVLALSNGENAVQKGGEKSRLTEYAPGRAEGAGCQDREGTLQ